MGEWGWEKRGGHRGAGRRNSALLVIKLQVHPIMDFIVPQRHVVLKNRVPLLQYDLVPAGASLGCNQLLKVPDGVISVALNADLLPQTVVANNLDHPVSNRWEPADTTTSSLEGRAGARVNAKHRKRKCVVGSSGPRSSQCRLIPRGVCSRRLGVGLRFPGAA